VDEIPQTVSKEVAKAAKDAGEALGLTDLDTLRKIVQRTSITS